ncbi:MAG: heavy metal translocating P-type ATPase [Actinobacteria bacterium]|nr:heavy metal translocating P-type ATPase [Actinomycetota bacterium]
MNGDRESPPSRQPAVIRNKVRHSFVDNRRLGRDDRPVIPIELSRRYPVVATTLGVGVVGLVLLVTGSGTASGWLVGGYALAVAAWQAWSMIRDLLHGIFGLDVLAVTAITATVLVGDHWAALIVVLMLTGGEALEDYANARAHREISALLERAPRLAHRADATGAFVDVPIDDVVAGDLVMVRPGEVVPVDGLLEGDGASFDESSLTGESLPVEHLPGEQVLSGSVSQQRVAFVRATLAAKDSQYQQIIDLVQAAADSKSPIVRLADRYAVPFTLVSLVIAGIAWWVSGDPVRFAQVLVVATPCPLLIAAPVAFLAGMSRAASSGVIVKSGAVMETLARTRTVALDKTGTLTHGQPVVDLIEPADGTTADDLLRVAAAAETFSAHVLAKTIVHAARHKQLRIPDAVGVEETTAAGMTAEILGRLTAVGNAGHVERLTGHTPSDRPVPPGHIAIHVGTTEGYLGRILLTDQVRNNAPATLHALHRLGVRTVAMLTGDAVVTATHVAEQIGIDDVRAGLLPADKVAQVAALPLRPVAMVGDGVNDAPVLAAADVGIAMGAKGATAASESADVVIMLDDLSRVATSVAIAQRTVRIALQAIWLGIIISVGLMLVTVWGVLPAIVGAALQELVDLAAILMALRAVRPGPTEHELGRELRRGVELRAVAGSR